MKRHPIYMSGSALSTLWTATHLVLIILFQGKYFIPFTNEEIKVQRILITASK